MAGREQKNEEVSSGKDAAQRPEILFREYTGQYSYHAEYHERLTGRWLMDSRSGCIKELALNTSEMGAEQTTPASRRVWDRLDPACLQTPPLATLRILSWARVRGEGRTRVVQRSVRAKDRGTAPMVSDQ